MIYPNISSLKNFIYTDVYLNLVIYFEIDHLNLIYFKILSFEFLFFVIIHLIRIIKL